MDNDCINVNSRCYRPDILVRCHAISNVDACERRHFKSDGSMDNSFIGKKFCGKEHQAKHICISINSTIDNFSLDGELNWMINRVNDVGDSCKACACCDIKKKECVRTSGICTTACDPSTPS